MLNKIIRLFKSEQSAPDLIEVLNLEEWYQDLSDDQRHKLHQYSTSFGAHGEVKMLDQSVTSTSRTAQDYLMGVGSTAANEKDYEFAEMVLLSALEFEDGSATSTHFTYNALIDLYYKQRDDKENAIDQCIGYCLRDIEIADDFVEEFGDVPRIPSFKRLAIIYEKQGRNKDALDVCDQAIKIGTTDGTKGGFEARKKRIRKKMNQ